MQFRQRCESIDARAVTYGGKIVITPASAWSAGGGSEGRNHRRVKLIIVSIYVYAHSTNGLVLS